MNIQRKHTGTTTSVLLIAITLASCSTYECGPFDTTLSVQDVTTTAIQSVQVVLKDATDQSNPVVQTNSETQASLDEIEIQVEMAFTVTPMTTTDSSPWTIFDWILPTAHACSPPIRRGDVQSMLRTIDMFSAADLSAGYPAGESLSPLFSVTEIAVDNVFYGDAGPLNTTAMQSLGNRSIPMMLSFNINRLDTNVLTPDITAEPNIHRFTITVEFENGLAFSMDSNNVSLPVYESL